MKAEVGHSENGKPKVYLLLSQHTSISSCVKSHHFDPCFHDVQSNMQEDENYYIEDGAKSYFKNFRYKKER